MTYKTRSTKSTGVVSTQGDAFSGFQVERDSSNKGFFPFPVDSVYSVTTNVTLSAGDAGVVTLSGSTVGLTGTLPVAANVPGTVFVFRNMNASLDHQLTGSQETAGVKAFYSSGSSGGGSKLTIASGAGKAVVLISTGLNYLVLAETMSTIVISGT